MSVNKVIIIGNVGKDPEIRSVGLDSVASLSIATTERYKDKSGNTQESTEWHKVTAWRSQAEFVSKYVKKGAQVYVEGKLTTRKWTDNSGAERYSTEIQAQSIQLLGRKEETTPQAFGNGPI